ncbi:mRNA splicing factor RNA helicase [Ophiocordyceps camponoti-floridani]|uniref:mRNA splicing factor RNA helicase n=1 Tax=Ophiocordyceps camponoti-floridani TaxID=2030778 RepID=A0A8H4VGB8_9HYPO|nr:mRNA splicing factor RNA helicase [Ophiocordyceps camponoti-floridani]
MESNRRPSKPDTVSATTSISAPDEDKHNDDDDDDDYEAPESRPPKQADQPTKHGKLFEVAIPQHAHSNPRNRRGSDDLKRDDFVDQFLHENKLNVYDHPLDDRMADQFRRQYLDELAARRNRRRRAPRPARPAPPPGEILRGPKLGGSRNSRAAIRNILLQQEKEKVGRKP